MSTLIMWHNRFSENGNEAVEAHIPRHRDSKTFFQRTKTSRFQDWKTTTSKFQDQKATVSSSCGILTLMPPDIPWCSGYSAIVPRSVVPCSGVPALFRRSAGVPCSVVPCSGVPGSKCGPNYIPRKNKDGVECCYVDGFRFRFHK